MLSDSMVLLLIVLLLLMVLLFIKSLNIYENYGGSDYSNMFWGTELWNGWPY